MNVDNLGPGIVASPITSAAKDGTDLFLGTRGIRPTSVLRYDLATDRVVASAALPIGSGSWAATAAGGVVHLGTYAPAAIVRYDPVTNQTRLLADLPEEDFVWDLVTARDGTLYAGSYPGGRVYAIDPTTGEVDDLGEACPGQRYVRCVAIGADGTVYAGAGGETAHLMAYDPTLREFREVLSIEGETFVRTLVADADRVVAGTAPHGYLVVVDRTSGVTTIDVGEGGIDAILLEDDGVVFATGNTGAVFRFRAGALERLGVPAAEEARALVPIDGGILGVTGGGDLWKLGTPGLRSLLDAGAPGGPEPVQSVSVDGENAYVGGNYRMSVHDLRTGDARRIVVGGEAKKSLSVDGKLYLALYPGAHLETYDPRTGEVERIATLGGRQNRPLSLVHHAERNALLIGSRSDYGLIGGSFSRYSLDTGAVERLDDPLPQQGVSAIAADGCVAYLGGSIGADGVEGVASECELAAVDLSTFAVLWRWVPLAGEEAILSLRTYGDHLYGLTNRGTLFRADVAAREVVATYSTPDKTSGTLFERGGDLYGASGDTVFRVDADGLTIVADGLAGDWFNPPAPYYDEKTDAVYTIRDRDLVRVRLSD
ncbi:PQQ-binding-like beta-propeller repeat protein [Tenggerimyces flavus]|uniref:PQQ-binding-like beta-propeller repeat protein n=1 Tax=Tenggerimyces flavus TaxID=1708749 RepID=A0ABV7YJH9_9ACTN|nr:PQQ-binding-like beta-propeller repeat protein [Tenggerimyces flavus]MBM7789819.1 outer membrane protein assembly factor BamB [Tenggerimyces flavus]